MNCWTLRLLIRSTLRFIKLNASEESFKIFKLTWAHHIFFQKENIKIFEGLDV